MANPAPAPSNSAPAAPGPSNRGRPAGNQPRQRFFYNPYANRKICRDYHDKPYLFYTTTPGPGGATGDPFKCIVNTDKLTAGLPNGWKLYFHDDDPVVLKPEILTRQIKYFRDYLRSCPSRTNYKHVHKTASFEVDLDDLEMEYWRSFAEDLKARPEHTIACLALAMHLELNQSSAVRTARRPLLLLTPRISNLELPICGIKDLVMDKCGSLVRVRGTVIIQASEPSIEWIWRAFKCGACATKQVVLQRDGKSILPNSCKGCNQRGKDYSVDIESHYNVPAESQTLWLQEHRTVAAVNHKMTDVPPLMELLVKGDLVNKIPPGTDVMCTGILKSRIEGDTDRRYYLYLEVIASETNEEADERNFDYSERDYLVVQRMKSEADPFRLLVQSICPKILGQEMIKASLILGLFSVSPKDFIGRRREAHVLLIGDPGLGKSELLEACSVISPRGVFVSSNSCTNTGLTATMSNDYAKKSTIEAGALVMSDQGVCCIDELDKITTSMNVLLEAMEDQVVNVAKAGVINQLGAKSSVLAAANPIGRHYNKTKTIEDNLKIGMPVMSRFDLVLVLIDQKNNSLVDGRFLERKSEGSLVKVEAGDLQARLKLNSNERLDVLTPSCFQKYLSYVNRKYIPVLSQEAKLVVKEYYLKLRNQPFYSDIIPVTNRCVLSLVRLTQARAKIDCSRVATKAHAQDVIQLMDFGMRDVRNITEEDIAIQQRVQNKEPKYSKAKQMNNLTRVMQIRAKNARLTIFTKADMKELALKAGVRNVNEIIELLNVNGVLLRKDSETFQFVNY